MAYSNARAHGEAVLRTFGFTDDAGPLVPLHAGAVKSDLTIDARMG